MLTVLPESTITECSRQIRNNAFLYKKGIFLIQQLHQFVLGQTNNYYNDQIVMQTQFF